MPFWSTKFVFEILNVRQEKKGEGIQARGGGGEKWLSKIAILFECLK